MRNALCCTLLLACCELSQAGDPPLPMPPETPAVESRVQTPALPATSPTPAGPASRRAAPAMGAIPMQAAPVYIGPFDPGVYYRPEAVVPPVNDGLHLRAPYYSYRRPWYPPGPASVNVTIVW